MTIDLGALIGAVLAFLAAVVVAIINSKSQATKFLTALDKQIALVMYRLDQVEKQLAIREDTDSRIAILEERFANLETFVKTILTKFEEKSK